MDDTQLLVGWLGEAYPAAYRTACLILRNPADAEEAVQEAFLRVWRFRAAIPDGAGRRGWLYRVVVNACLSRLRAEAARPDRGGSLERIELASHDDPAADAVHSLRADAVITALAELPEALRVPLVLRYYAGLSEKEIALAIRRRPGTVKSRLHEGRRRLALDPHLSAWVVEATDVVEGTR